MIAKIATEYPMFVYKWLGLLGFMRAGIWKDRLLITAKYRNLLTSLCRRYQNSS